MALKVGRRRSASMRIAPERTCAKAAARLAEIDDLPSRGQVLQTPMMGASLDTSLATLVRRLRIRSAAVVPGSQRTTSISLMETATGPAFVLAPGTPPFTSAGRGLPEAPELRRRP